MTQSLWAKIWNDALKAVASQTPPAQTEAYLRRTTVLGEEDGRLMIGVPDRFVKETLERHFLGKLEESLEEQLGRALPVTFVVRASEGEAAVRSTSPRKPERSDDQVRSNLSPKYTMASYVVGAGNKFAHAAGLAVIKSPGDTYNPLFIWGPVGVGKTHLMQAIGGSLLAEHESIKLIYVTAEDFTNEWIDAIKGGSAAEFRRRYRTKDVLLIDDVQFFEEKEGTQEAFFHTFNELYAKRRQIIVTCDRPPKQLEKVPDRLVNRFESGLIADIKPPDLETRIAILKKLADRHRVAATLEPLTFLAERFASNVRELEGAFTRVLAEASLQKVAVTKALCESALAQLLARPGRPKLTPDLITQIVATQFNVAPDEMMAKRQDRRIVRPRQIAMYLIHELMGETLKRIGQSFGKRDHTTVLYAIEKIAKEVAEQTETGREVMALKQRIREMARP